MESLIYGKDQSRRVVGLEATDSTAEVFMQDENGNIHSKFIPNRYWILSSQNHGRWARLKGNLHYKWGKQYDELDAWKRDKYSLKGRDIFLINNEKEALMVKDGITYVKDMKPQEVTCLSFDIETTSLHHDSTAKLLLISNSYRKNGVVERKLFSYDEHENEGAMIEAWCSWVREKDPSFIIGHNIYGFDLPYIKFIADREGVQMNLGRNGSAIRFNSYESKFRKDQTQDLHYKKAFVYGREFIDTLFLSIKMDIATKKYESYGLKNIIKQEGWENPDRVFYDASQIRFHYKNEIEWEKIKAYCVFDADDALLLYDKFIPPFFYLAQSVAKPFQLIIESATGSQVNSMMLRSYLQQGHSVPRADEAVAFEGAVSLGNPGIYSNAFKVDVSSLYPSIIRQYEVYDKEKDPQGNFLKLIDTFTLKRLEYKKLAKTDAQYDHMQNSFKIVVNSGYGFMGASGLNFNSPRQAAFITNKGREILNQSIDWMKEKNGILVNADTDSITFCKHDQSEFSEQERADLLQDLNSRFPEKITFEDDGYYKKLIVIKIKNYVLWDGKKVKLKGSALKGSTKEPALQQFMKDIINSIIEEKYNYKEIYDRYAKEILNVKEIKRWCTRKTLSDKVFNAQRTNEQKVLDAIEGTEYAEGDRAYFFFKSDGSLELVEKFSGEYDAKKLLSKLYKTSEVFHTIIPKETFPNYALKKNKNEIEAMK